MKNPIVSRPPPILLLALTAGLMLLTGSSLAAQAVASSSAFGESVNLNIAPLLGGGVQATSGPLPQVSGSAAPAYSRSATALSAAVSTGVTGALLQTGVLNVTASSQMPAAVLTHATAETDGTALTLGHLISLLNLHAQVIQSAATIDGTCGSSLTAAGSSDLLGVTTGVGLGLSLLVPSHPAPNTVLLNVLGVRIILNEQIRTGNGVTTQGLTVNAIHVALQNSLLSGLGLLSGDIVISQSKAGVQCPAAGPAASADLTIAGGISPSPVTSGGTIHYQITVTNQGPDPATAVVLTDVLPAGVGGASVSTGQGTCVLGPPVSCQLGTLTPGQSVQVTISGTVTATSGTLTDTATVASGVADPNAGNNSVTLITQVAGPANLADLALTAVASVATVAVGHADSFTFTATNLGPVTASAVTLNGPLVARADVRSISSSQGNCSANGSLSCNLGSLAPGQQVTITVTVVPTSSGEMFCEATVASAVADPNLGNNSASASIDVSSPTTTPPGAVDPGSCRIDTVPAATLLIPYFEVDLDNPNGATTLVGITNAAAANQLAQITLWSDWGIPTLSFTIALTGYDVQTLNLRDIFNGALPALATGAGCPTQGVEGVLSLALVNHLQAWHSGRPSPSLGTCAAPARADHIATGYLTVDAVNRCSSSNPTQAGYFAAGGTGIASDNNVLFGDFSLVNPDDDLAHGDPAVHILALKNTFLHHYSFYSSFVNGTGVDDRQPLGTSYASRYVSGGTFDGGTQLIVWRDSRVANPVALACGTEPVRMEMAGTLFDEEENVSLLPSSTQMAPWSTQKMQLGDAVFPLPHAFGWVDLDLWHTGGITPFGNAAQGWVTTIMSAHQRFSIGLRAVRLDSACDF